jgi:iron complex outermembrane receptor protein
MSPIRCRTEPHGLALSRLASAVRVGACAVATITLLPSLAMAQDAAGANAPSSEANAPTQLDTVVITTSARKRKEAIQSVPISMDLLGGREIKDSGVTRVQDLQSSVPGLVITTYESQGNISLRGVGTGDVGLGTDQSVAIHVDGVYQAYGGAGLTRLFDVSRVEVLKGPQGTLYGRNSTAGVVNVISNAPSDRFGVEADVSFGSDRTVITQGMINTPLGEGNALRLAFIHGNSDGSLTNDKDGSKVTPLNDFYGFRFGVRSQFDSTRADLRVQYIEDKSDGLNRQVPIPYAHGSVPATNNFDSAYFIEPTYTLKKDLNIALTLTGEVGDAQWTSITGYGRHSGGSKQVFGFSANPADSAYLTVDEPYSQVSQEFQLNFTTGKATDWVAGLYMLSFKGEDNRFYATGLSSAPIDVVGDGYGKSSGKTAALFTDVSHPLTSQLKINGGLRYTWEKKDATAFGLGPFDVNPEQKADKTWTAFSGRVGLDYALTSQTMLWGSISQGFKSGGVIPNSIFGGGGSVCDGGNFTSGCSITIYRPEKLLAYEVGQKTTLLDGAGIVNAALFYYDYKDKVEFYTYDPTNPLSFTFNNAQKARVIGAEANADLRLTRYLRWDIAAAYLDTEYTRFVDVAGNSIATGNELARAPKFSYTLGLVGEKLPVGSIGLAQFRLEYAWRDQIYFDIFNNAAGNHTYERSIGLLNAAAKLDITGSPFSIYVAGRNLTDKRYTEFGRDDLSFSVVAPRRTLQIGVSYRM